MAGFSLLLLDTKPAFLRVGRAKFRSLERELINLIVLSHFSFIYTSGLFYLICLILFFNDEGYSPCSKIFYNKQNLIC